tara:strand:+ start:2501 stop:2719 length:219 start_codon:yes stop_codon:yes gene_type:complete
MSAAIPATSIVVEMCSPDCKCHQVHLLMRDGEGDAFAIASMSPVIAREIAADLQKSADVVEASQLKHEGRLG